MKSPGWASASDFTSADAELFDGESATAFSGFLVEPYHSFWNWRDRRRRSFRLSKPRSPRRLHRARKR